MKSGSRICAIALATAALLNTYACQQRVAVLEPQVFAGKPGQLKNPAGKIIVSPGEMAGWRFYDEQHDSSCATYANCGFVNGPGAPPSGTGSAELATPSAGEGPALVLPDYNGVKIADFTTLSYSTYRESADSRRRLAITLQFNVDYDLTDTATSYQARLIYEPYQEIGGNVLGSTWQRWNALNGKWWSTRASVWRDDSLVSNSCVRASPCTLSELLAQFPNLGVHSSLGAVVLKAGPGWNAFRGTVDNLTIGVNGINTTFDFELAPRRAAVPRTAPDTVSAALMDSLGFVAYPGSTNPPWRRSIVRIMFRSNTTQVARQAAVNAVDGYVVGGYRPPFGEGEYIVRISDTTAIGIESRLTILRALPQVEFATPAIIDTISKTAYVPVGPYADVPPEAPDSMPQARLDSLGRLSNPSAPKTWWARSAIMLAFRAGTSLEDRRDAVKRLQGRVIGGYRFPIGEGYYVIQVPDTTVDGIIRRVSAAKKLPQVESADPVILGETIVLLDGGISVKSSRPPHVFVSAFVFGDTALGAKVADRVLAELRDQFRPDQMVVVTRNDALSTLKFETPSLPWSAEFLRMLMNFAHIDVEIEVNARRAENSRILLQPIALIGRQAVDTFPAFVAADERDAAQILANLVTARLVNSSSK